MKKLREIPQQMRSTKRTDFPVNENIQEEAR